MGSASLEAIALCRRTTELGREASMPGLKSDGSPWNSPRAALGTSYVGPLIEDYALIGDLGTAALVSRAGSIDWYCPARFDSDACFAALLGTVDHGRWVVRPVSAPVRIERRYRRDTLVLETDVHTSDGVVRVVDCMPPRRKHPELLRVITGIRGRVRMMSALDPRFGYGRVVPWIRGDGRHFTIVAGPDALDLSADVPFERRDAGLFAEFDVETGRDICLRLTWHAAHNEIEIEPLGKTKQTIEDTESFWRSWAAQCRYQGPWRDDVVRSLITLKALTYAPTGGIVAAPTTSLPECIGGVRNWDYRYCWVRDATFTLYALLLAGYRDEARAWRDWLLRAVAGTPSQLQILYGVAGERRLPEMTLPWLPGFEASVPVRVGNAAVDQFQLDVFGELIDCLHQTRQAGIHHDENNVWALQRAILDFLESNWERPDDGIWEFRGPSRHFTHSKVMAWVAFDRAIKAVERFGAEGPLPRWRAIRARLHQEVCEKAFDTRRNTFTQHYGSQELDASLLMIPLVGFLPPDDARVRGTVEAIERELCHDGFVIRYPTQSADDGLPAGEGVFLPCSFWLADNLSLIGRKDDARALFDRLLSVRNDLGLLSEEYDPHSGRLLGNFPQAFSHVALINTARNLAREGGPAEARRSGKPVPVE